MIICFTKSELTMAGSFTWYWQFRVTWKKSQPHSLALSSTPPLVVGRKNLVAAGHMTTQNLSGKKICWAGGVLECFVSCCDKLLWVSSSSS